ncbi:hypothetical protein EC973_002004 [Apophysomyces ossiformis]|uniref:MACPF domain-containing protein n=1 Tax=Apophysomyces ossiformis TaxID=679940 RepID=A0A8H7BPE0_9FUNG|nr:hypothetical protein EC973_002004 [Apophysomyces ossiformis]
MIGGKILYKSSTAIKGAPQRILENVFKKKLSWHAIGGETSLLHDGQDISGWLESTATNPKVIAVLDVNPTYDLLSAETSEEIQRIYQVACHKSQVRIHPPLTSDEAHALVCLSKAYVKVGVTKGIHIDGALAKEDAVELVNRSDVKRLIRSVTVGGKPRVECMVRLAMLGTTLDTHAFLPKDALDETEECSGFRRAAMAYHLRVNGGELQPSTREVRYFVMYVTHRELVFDPDYVKATDNFRQAINKALAMENDQEKYKELQKVFERFGYYYPSTISLGGRLTTKTFDDKPLGARSFEEAMLYTRKLLDMSSVGRNVKAHTIGGSPAVTGSQDWIDSVGNNQTRIQFGSMRPLYELLDGEQRGLIVRLYDEFKPLDWDLPDIPKAVHFDGVKAQDKAIEYIEGKTLFKMIMLKKFSEQPLMQHISKYGNGFEDIERYTSLDIRSDIDFPGSTGFIAGSKAAYKERHTLRKPYKTKRSLYETGFVIYKELHLYDEFIRPTRQFQEAIRNALQVGKQDIDKYYALQDVFQRFGYFYPSIVQIGGRITLKSPAAQEIKSEKLTAAANEQVTKDTERQRQSGNSREITKYERKLSKQILSKAIEKSIARSEKWTALGGDSVSLLWNDVKSWISTVKGNQVTIRYRDLQPLYKLLDEEQRHKVQLIYENILMMDHRLRYHYLLEMTIDKAMLTDQCSNDSREIYEPTDSLFETLMAETFDDSIAALDFCRNICYQWEFFIIEEMVTDEIICIYCAHGKLSEDSSYFSQPNQRICPWSVMLSQDEDGLWRFHKFEDESECLHNHKLLPANTSNEEVVTDERKTPLTTSKAENKVIVELLLVAPVRYLLHYVRYGDIVRLRLKYQQEPLHPDTYKYVSASKILKATARQASHDANLELANIARRSDNDFLWKIVRCPLGATDSLPDTHINVETSEDTGNNHILNGDVVFFESQAFLKGGERVYLHMVKGKFECIVWKDPKPELRGWRVRHVNDYVTKRIWQGNSTPENKKKLRLDAITRKISLDSAHDQYRLGRACMYGMLGVDIDNARAMKYLRLAANQGHIDAYFHLAILLQNMEEYQKALDVYNEAAFVPVLECYRDLGDLYHTGFSRNGAVVPKSPETAFLCYSVASIFGDIKAALRVGEYYEKGLHHSFGVDYSKALRWYEYISSQFNIPAANTAIGRVKHTLANATTDPLKQGELRQEAFKAFNEAVNDDPYAKFMVGMYHLNGWVHQQSDPNFGFQTLLSLIETGLDMAFFGISKCYEEGIGVEQDSTLAAVFRELAVNMSEL